MSSKEALDLDGSAKKGRARKAGPVWESKMMVKTADVNTVKIRSRSSRMSNAEIQVDKQSPTSATNKRSDFGIIRKSPPQIKRTRSASTTTVADEINTLKLRKIKSGSDHQVPLDVDQHTTNDEIVVADLNEEDVGIIKSRHEADEAITTNNEDHHLEKEEEEEEEEEEKLVSEEKKLLHSNDRSPPPTVEEIAPARIQQKINPIPDHHHHGTSSRLESFADLIMWRDASRSAFVFGVGAFAIISSSYTKDLNISCISVLSYLGLVYLAASFILRSIISRENVDTDSRDEEYVVGEEEAVWLIKLVLPYVNEFLSKLRSLFSGDPATTMKLAVLLFILARCGGSITIWKMTKLGFFGVFMVPKLCSSYSSQLAAYGTFWIRRFGDAWESCSHKKAVAFGIFSLVWNLSSVVARIWSVFLLFVAFKYYQQCRIKEEGLGEEVATPYSGKPVPPQNLNSIDIKTQKIVC